MILTEDAYGYFIVCDEPFLEPIQINKRGVVRENLFQVVWGTLFSFIFITVFPGHLQSSSDCVIFQLETS